MTISKGRTPRPLTPRDLATVGGGKKAEPAPAPAPEETSAVSKIDAITFKQ